MTNHMFQVTEYYFLTVRFVITDWDINFSENEKSLLFRTPAITSVVA